MTPPDDQPENFTVKHGTAVVLVYPWRHSSGEWHWRWKDRDGKHHTRKDRKKAKSDAFEMVKRIHEGTVDLNALPEPTRHAIQRLVIGSFTLRPCSRGKDSACVLLFCFIVLVENLSQRPADRPVVALCRFPVLTLIRRRDLRRVRRVADNPVDHAKRRLEAPRAVAVLCGVVVHLRFVG